MVHHSALVIIAVSVACSRTGAFKPAPLTRATLVKQQRPTATRAVTQKVTSSLFGSFPFSRSMEKATPSPVAEPRGGVETVKSYFGHWNEREMEQAVALFSQDCVYEDTLYPKQFKGRPALKKHLLKVANALPESFSFVLDEVSDGGNTIGVQWHVESNGAQLPFTRGCSVYKLDPATGLIKSGFDVPEPTVKSGSVSLAILSAASSIIDAPKRAIALGAFLFYCWFVFLSDIAPGYNALALDPATWQEVKDLSLNFWLVLPFFSPESAPVIHPVLEGVFNFLLAWAALFAGFMIDGRVSNKPESKNAFLPYIVGIQFLTNAVLLPWFLVRPTESQYRKLYSEVKSFAPLSKAEAFGESRLLPIVFGVVGLASLAWALGGRPEYGVWGERWGSFIELAGTDRLTFSFLVDLAYFAYFQHWLLKDDAARRGYTGSLTLDSNVPFLGLVYWLLTRPPLPGVTESQVLSEVRGKESAPQPAQSAAPVKPVVRKQRPVLCQIDRSGTGPRSAIRWKGPPNGNRKEAGAVKRRKLEGESGGSEMQNKDEAERGKYATCWRGQARLRAILRGMDWAAEQVVLKAGSVEARQRVVEQLCLHASRVTCEPVRSRAFAHITAVENWWKQSRVGVEWIALESSNPTAAEVVRMVRRVYAVESVGLYDDAKRELLRLLGSRISSTEGDGDSCSGLPYTVVDYLGFDPLHSDVTEVCNNGHMGKQKQRRLATALEIAWMADQTEFSLGGAPLFLAVLECLRSLRPYMGPYQVGYEEYRGQVHLITKVVLLLSKMGELQLLNHLLPHETLFLRHHLPVLLLRRDAVLVARTVEALKVLGSTEDDQLIQVGLAFLLAHQEEHGYWKCASDSSSSVDECYEATTAAIRALLVHEFRGFGPVPPETVSVLLQWQKLDEDCNDTDTPSSTPDALLLPTGEADTRLAGVKEAAENFLASCKSVRPPAPTPLVQQPLLGARANVPVARRSDSELSSASGPVVQRSDSEFSLTGEREENGVAFRAPVVQPPGMSLRDWILELKEKLKTAEEQKDWKGVYRTLKALNRIEGFNDPKLLSDTEIGKVVNNFAKKCENERCKTLAQEVVGKWKSRAKERQAAEQAKVG